MIKEKDDKDILVMPWDTYVSKREKKSWMESCFVLGKSVNLSVVLVHELLNREAMSQFSVVLL